MGQTYLQAWMDQARTGISTGRLAAEAEWRERSTWQGRSSKWARATIAHIWRHLQRRRTQTTIAAIFLPLIPLGMLAMILDFTTTGLHLGYDYDEVLCDVYGNVIQEWSRWSPSYWITVTYGWGRFSFASVKAIDVAWDWIIGRGWQAISGWIVYHVFRRCWAVRWTAEQHSIPVDAAMALQYEPLSIPAFWTYYRVLWRRSATYRIKWDTVVLLMAVIYVFLSPTWLSAMTGYISPNRPLLKLEDVRVPINTMPPCYYVVADGQRVGLIPNACIPYGGKFSDYYSAVYYCELLPR